MTDEEFVNDPVVVDSKIATILLVEDNEEFRFYLKDSLQPFYHIIEAANGKEGWQKTDVTMATVLKGQGYATGQFGKNHLGDRDDMLPTAHGFDEFYEEK